MTYDHDFPLSHKNPLFLLVSFYFQNLIHTLFSPTDWQFELFALGSVRFNLDPFHQYTDQQIWDALEAVNLKRAIEQLEGETFTIKSKTISL
jgi:ABC-type multidrug transport system fused ATPase/permease subunit